ncbi:menaquinone biosynthetic enzyme MqnA/MqnD family protein [Paenibacillus gorillae]|uniref:menaquinone biosynthetic enzyme MqnA/MqnD family protein n=1 Tax=Paenibacillus gorillae TaxID=1243662 RepID=UPI0004B2DC0B|nr:menaquinone biosynthesis protein [Paenibacillus gorillae]
MNSKSMRNETVNLENHKDTLTVGRIDYANAWPLFHHLTAPNMEIVSRVPSVLNRLLQEGDIQVAAISSFSYGVNADKYLLLPHLSVGSEGKVNSIYLFLKEPLEKVQPKRIAVSATSATSVNLLKIIMSKRFGLEPEYETAEPVLEDMLAHADAALLIGDPAIHASWEQNGLYRMDLGELWNEWSGLAMTFAVVAVRKEAADAAPEALAAIYKAFLEGKRQSLADLQPLIDKACAELGGDAAYWQMYFTSLQYDFGPKQQEGLSLYFRYAKELGLLEQDVELRFYQYDQSAE